MKHTKITPSRYPTRLFIRICCIALFVLSTHTVLGISPASGQDEKKENKQSGMGQGEAKISVKSSVRFSIRGQKATGGQRLEALGEMVRSKIPKIQECYTKSVASNPTQTGDLEVSIEFEAENTRPIVKFRELPGLNKNTTLCVQKALETIELEKKYRPAAAIATIEFNNTRAEGQKEMEERRDNARETSVPVNVEGKPEIKWGAPGGKVEFTITGEVPSAEKRLPNVREEITKALGSFLDCRRKAGKRGASPASITVINISLTSGEGNSAKIKSTTLANEKAVDCIEDIFSRFTLEADPLRSQVSVKIEFTD